MSVRPLRLLAVAAAVGLAAAACGGGDDTGASPGPTPAAETAAPTPESTPEVRTISVEVRDGEVVGGLQRVQVPVGEEVEIVVVSDVADHVHVHGYDLMEDVEAGGEARVSFTADIPGVFEVELEDRGLQLLTLEVR